jgi:hypothetical protein
VPVAPKTATSTPLIVATSTAPTLHDLVVQAADKYDVNPLVMDEVINCESGWNPRAVGDHGTSFGLSQIHLPAHPDITAKQAEDPKFAIDYMASTFAQGHAREWSCYQSLKDLK